MIRAIVLTCAFAALSAGQPPAAQPATRAEEIEQERARKAAALKPEDVSTFERFARDFKDKRWMERVGAGYNGFRVKLGNMITGGGFALGPEYYRQDLRDGNLTVRAFRAGYHQGVCEVRGRDDGAQAFERSHRVAALRNLSELRRRPLLWPRSRFLRNTPA